MSQTFEFYDTQAKQAAKQAAGAELDNVRDRHLRAEKTWRGLAEQARKVSDMRDRDNAARAARREAEREEADLASQAQATAG